MLGNTLYIVDQIISTVKHDAAKQDAATQVDPDTDRITVQV